MKLLFLVLIFITPLSALNVYANEDTHVHLEMSDGSSAKVDQARFDAFSEGLKQAKILVVSVKGMVCDFCARGIEKTFKRDPDLLKIDVDLNFGKVLMAYKPTAKINEKSIATTIRDNGQEVVKIDTLY